MKHVFFIILVFSQFCFSKTILELEKKLNEKVEENITINEFFEISALKTKHTQYKRSNGVFLIGIYPSKGFSEEVLKAFKTYKTTQAAINLYSEIFKSPSNATGFLYKGYLVTNFHVCRGQNIIGKDYNEDIVSFKVLKFNPTQDICILKPNFNTSKYFDFNSLNKKRNIAANSKEDLILDKKDIYIVDSMFGKIESNKIEKDTQKDEWSKENAYSTNNLKSGECRGGISGSPVYSDKGFFGIAWGSTTNEEDKDLQRCYIVEKNSIDLIINSL